MNDGKRYTIGEIAIASGIPKSTLQGRRKRLGIPGRPMGYTLDEAKQIIKRPYSSRRRMNNRMIADLRRRLESDGSI